MRRNNKQRTTQFILLGLLLIGVVYALLQANLQINGIAKILNNTWDVHFDNIQVNEDSVPIGENDSAATIDPENNCKVDFSVTLSVPGDFYEFTIDVVNSGTIDGMIGSLNKQLKVNNEVVEEIPDYLNYSVTYSDGVEIEDNHKLSAETTETYLVRLEFKSDVEELPQAATISTSLEPQYIQADSGAIPVRHLYSLYTTFVDEANSGSGLVEEYTGGHHDSYTEEPSASIYHWKTDNSAAKNSIRNKFNVIFGNHCWQMIRTTDTGGVKLIYNGEVENNQCLDTRETHVGYSSQNYTNINNSNYWYGTDYIYDSSNGTFHLAGTTTQSAWTEQTASELYGMYTCMSSTENASCSYLYIVNSPNYNSNNYCYFLSIVPDASYSSIGNLPFNSGASSISNVGYMYGDYYGYNTTWITEYNFYSDVYQTVSLNVSPSLSYWYADSVNYQNGVYRLVDPYKISSTDDYENLAGKYTFNSSNQNMYAQTVYYISAYQNGVNHVATFDNGDTASTAKFYVSDSITDNLDGTYTLDNAQIKFKKDWYSEYSSYNKKYICSSATCSNPVLIDWEDNCRFRYISVNDKILIAKGRNGFTLTDTLLARKDLLYLNYNDYVDYKYTCGNNSDICTADNLKRVLSWKYHIKYASYYLWGSSVVWDGEKYNLVDSIDFENVDDVSKLSDHHYVCLKKGATSCETVAYIYYYSYSVNNSYDTGYYISLSNGTVSIEQVLDNMLKKNNYNSIIKTGIERWYEKYLSSYDQYLEDTIFCNNRTISDYAGWNSNGGNTSNSYFSFSNNLDRYECANETDQFSVSNSKAHLNYKIGLMTAQEKSQIAYNPFNINETMWTMTPGHFERYQAKVYTTYSVPENVSSSRAVRPVISLKPGTKYDDGDGSMEHPYIIKTN